MKKTLLLPIVLAIATVGCIHKASGPVTPKERAATYNAVLAQTNDTIEQGAEAASASGVITAAQAKPIIQFASQVATLHKQVTVILGQATVTTADLASISVLLDQIKSAGDQAIASGALGIKNPKSMETFKADLDALYSAADAILSALQQIQTGGK